MPALTLAPCSIVTDNIGWTCFVRLVAGLWYSVAGLGK